MNLPNRSQAEDLALIFNPSGSSLNRLPLCAEYYMMLLISVFYLCASLFSFVKQQKMRGESRSKIKHPSVRRLCDGINSDDHISAGGAHWNVCKHEFRVAHTLTRYNRLIWRAGWAGHPELLGPPRDKKGSPKTAVAFLHVSWVIWWFRVDLMSHCRISIV